MQEIYDFEWEMEHDAFARVWRCYLENEAIRDMNEAWDPEWLKYVGPEMLPYSCPHGSLPNGFLLSAEVTEWPEGDIPQPEGVLGYRMRRTGIIY